MNEEETKLAKEKYKLTDKQIAFCEVYLETENARTSYQIAYENDNLNTSGVNGHKLLQLEKVTKYIAERKQELLSDNRVATKEMTLKFWTTTMLNPSLSMRDRIDASKLLGKHQGLLDSTLNVNHQMDFDIKLIDSAQNNIIDQHTKAIEQKDDELYEADYEEVEDEE